MSIAEGVSWLRDEVDLAETRSQVCFQSLKAWWRETTDIVILNSPLLNRATGNAFRCITLCSLTFITFTRSDKLVNIHLFSKVTVFAVLVLLIIGSLTSFLPTVWRQRETVRWSWFYCFVSAVSLHVLTYEMVLSDETRFLYIAAVLCHCNLHPIPLLFVIGSIVCHLSYSTIATILLGGYFMGSFATIDGVWCITTLLLMFCAFTQDFTVRVKAISTGMILPREGGQPHDSPLSGRSARSICWLMVLSIWLAWVSLMIEKASYQTQAGKHYEYIFENRLPICTWLVPLVPLAAIFALRVSGRGGRCALWQADLTLFICSCTPPAMIFVDLILLGAFGSDKPEPLRLEFVRDFQCRVQAMLVTAEQLLVQAGCHPILSTGPCVLLALQFVASYFFHQDSWYSELEHHDLRLSLALSCIVWIGHTVNYITRYRAISEGLERARENADSTHFFLHSILNPTHSGLELQPLGTTITGPSVAVAVVRHAERADAAQALDDWGCSKDNGLDQRWCPGTLLMP